MRAAVAGPMPVTASANGCCRNVYHSCALSWRFNARVTELSGVGGAVFGLAIAPPDLEETIHLCLRAFDTLV
jgi:hypothetical protein